VNYWLLLCSPDKWFGEKSDKNVEVNEKLLTLEYQPWSIQERYFRDAIVGDKCIVKVGQDNRSKSRRTLDDGSEVEILEAGIYAIGELSKGFFIDEAGVERVEFKAEENFFAQNAIIPRKDAEEILGEGNYFSQSSKKISELEYQRVLDYFDDVNQLTPNQPLQKEIYPAQVKVERANYSIFELKRQFSKGKIVLDPEFQRESVWKSKKQKSELVESILMGIPLPIVYFSENSEGRLQVVDGRQRLTTLFEFLDDGFSLSELNILKQLTGKKFSGLSPIEQSDLEDYQLIAYVIKPPTPDRIKFDIFDRVNRGGTRLNNQEMRNALYQGKVVKLLKELSQLESFLKATNFSVNPTRMKDRYLILRFLAFYLWQEKRLLDKNGKLLEYKSDIDEFLGKSMEIINEFDEVKIEELKGVFELAMKNAYYFLGKNAFRIPSSNDKLRPVSMALFEVFGYLMSFEFMPNIKKATLNRWINGLFEEDKFISSITYNLDSSISVNQRFQMVENILQEIRDDQ
jgi:hypothetical protein